MKLLHIIASPRGSRSRTLQVSHEFLTALRKKYSALQVDEMDLLRKNFPKYPSMPLRQNMPA